MKNLLSSKDKVIRLNRQLLQMYGRQGWWPTTSEPGKSPVYHPGQEGRPVSDDEAFEIITGAILTQNTAWTNVEKAIIKLSEQGLLSIHATARCDANLEIAIKPARYFNQKAKRLRNLARIITEIGGIKNLRAQPTPKLRELLLSWNGIGPETADSILCYAFGRPVFVVDNYAQRLFRKLNLPSGSYDEIQQLVHQSLTPSASEYGDFHARIVKVFTMKGVEELAAAIADRLGDTGRKRDVLQEFRVIPGVGEKISEDLWDMGFRAVEELRGQAPEDLYCQLSALRGENIDRCMLYVFRCAMYFVSNDRHDPELLKWWRWKD